MNRLTNIEDRQRKSRKHDYLFASVVFTILTLMAMALTACAVDVDETQDPVIESMETQDMPSDRTAPAFEAVDGTRDGDDVKPPPLHCTSVALDKPCPNAIGEEN